MQLSIDIVRANTDKLTRTTWGFWLYSFTWVLTEYREEYKMPPSPNWRIKHRYDRIITRDNTIEAEQILVPEDVEAELLETFISKLIVTKWNNASKPASKR